MTSKLRRSMIACPAILALCVAGATYVFAPPASAEGDPIAGKLLYQEYCQQCHGGPGGMVRAAAAEPCAISHKPRPGPSPRVRALSCTELTDIAAYVRAPFTASKTYQGLWWAPSGAEAFSRFIQRSEEARLRMLQAQIEPHFLFNTLANVRRLYQTAPANAATMLDNLMRYFEVSLPQMRAADSTLGREAALTESYLEIQRIRMDRRLEFAIDIPEPLRESRLPPMMLVTLAENAIKHGLAPLPEGGLVSVSATAKGKELQVRVADSGQGFTQSSGGGTGLANIRARLAGLYGAAGRLTLAMNTPRGVIATIAIPLSAAPLAGGAE
jgi:hypothetical protein